MTKRLKVLLFVFIAIAGISFPFAVIFNFLKIHTNEYHFHYIISGVVLFTGIIGVILILKTLIPKRLKP